VTDDDAVHLDRHEHERHLGAVLRRVDAAISASAPDLARRALDALDAGEAIRDADRERAREILAQAAERHTAALRRRVVDRLVEALSPPGAGS